MRFVTSAFRPSASVLLLLPTPLLAATATVSVSGTPTHSISPYIYGVNSGTPLQGSTQATNIRLGGNRWTAYNWENNASNAGSDFGPYSNDDFLSTSNTPGEAVRPSIVSTTANNQALMVTVPIAGYVSADKNGLVSFNEFAPANGTATNPTYNGTRFKISLPNSPGAPSLTPNTTDRNVYANEYVNFVKQTAGPNRTAPLFYSLDNEPDLWNSTHREIRLNLNTPTGYQAVTYAEIRDRGAQYAAAIKSADSTGKVFGAVNYGFDGFYSLQNSNPDPVRQAWEQGKTGDNRWFTAFYLDAMKKASDSAGKRLLDVLDVHYYSEARSTTGVRVTENNNSPEVVAARLQAPRSLWDPTYTENSYIPRDILGAPLNLTQRLKNQINTYNPGTSLAITEYNFGGTNHISGAIAQADALGIFATQNYYAANFWDLTSGGANSAYARAAFDMFLNYDGQGSEFGDLSLPTVASNNATTSLYAALDSTEAGRLTLVALNKTNEILTLTLNLSDLPADYTTLLGYQLTSASTLPTLFDTRTLTNSDTLTLTLSPYSVSTFELTGTPIPEPAIATALLPALALFRRRR